MLIDTKVWHSTLAHPNRKGEGYAAVDVAGVEGDCIVPVIPMVPVY